MSKLIKWGGFILVLAVFFSFLWHENKAVKEGKAAVVKEYANEALEQKLEVYKGEIALLQKKDEASLAKIKLTEGIVNERDLLIDSLRSRPSRKEPTKAANVPSQGGAACTGAELSKEDGEFLAGEASRAEQLIVERDYYYGRYEDARLQMEKLNVKN